jgi:membrane associated rhomboid family serine protease
MITIKKDPKDVPVTVFISLSMIVIFLMFNAKVITSLPCGKSIHEVFISNFIHVDTTHLISNMYALYTISRVEQEMGFIPFIHLLIFLLIVNTIAELSIRRIWKDLPCSIGFSGILFGLFTWELVSKKKIDIEMLLAIVIMVVGPSLNNKNISLSGHFIGALSGMLAGVSWNFIYKDIL